MRKAVSGQIWKQNLKIFVVFAILFLTISHNKAQAALSDWFLGGNIQPFSTSDFGSDAMKSSLRELKDSGANYAVLIIPYYQADRSSTEMRPGWNTPTDEALSSAIDYAHSIGLKVMLTPHLETDYIEWRGNIDPPKESRPAWFASYQKMLIHYGEIAENHGVEDYCIGAELLRMTNPWYDGENTSRWEDMIAAVREIYGGRMTYSANRDYEVDVIGFWDKLDYVGLSAYYDLYHADNDSVAELKKSWDNWRSGVIEPIHKQFGKDVVFTELGYRSIDNTYRNPWDWGRDGGYNGQAQANAYEAVFDYWKDYDWMKGVLWWRWEVSPPSAGSGDTGYTPQNKPAEEVMKKYFGDGGSIDTSPGTISGNPPPNNPPVNLAGHMDVWWPADGSKINGLQPFKAMLTDNLVEAYDMFWRVDGDRLNSMSDRSEDWPHKEALVDLGSWTWNDKDGEGVYGLDFIAKDKEGREVFQKHVNITVVH